MNNTIENEYLKVVVNDKGAELASLFNKETAIEHIWQADPNVWGRHAPVLFPVVGRLENDRSTIESETFIMTQHGFARDQVFRLKGKEEKSLLYELSYDEDSLKKYPYKFSLEICYILNERRLEIQYKVTNVDSKKIYFSIGAHPGFMLPFYNNESFEDYFIEFEKEEDCIRLLLDGSLRSGEKISQTISDKKIPLNYNMFDDDAIILEGLKSEFVMIKSHTHQKGLKFDFAGFPLFAIWTKPKSNAPFICLEPWYGVTDEKGAGLSFKEKKNIESLEINGVFEAKHGIEIF